MDFSIQVTIEDSWVSMQKFANNLKASSKRQRETGVEHTALSISKSICEALGGSLDYQVNSDLGDKITFTMKAFH